MSHLDLWKSVEDINPKFTKPISGRDYKGTSPNPHYLVKLATEHLGPAGHGFGWETVGEGFEHLGQTVLHWCRIRFWWRHPETGEIGSFEAYGQTKAAYVTRNGDPRVDEDAPKKSMTDAFTKALAQIGFAANIYLGRWDDNKYVAQVGEEYARREAESQQSEKREAEERAAKLAVETCSKARTCKTVEELTAMWVGLSEALRADKSVRDTFSEVGAELKKEDAS
ncbi:MAG: hypothetical protein ACQEUZ_06275 [Pseudomonadota bacterium]